MSQRLLLNQWWACCGIVVKGTRETPGPEASTQPTAKILLKAFGLTMRKNSRIVTTHTHTHSLQATQAGKIMKVELHTLGVRAGKLKRELSHPGVCISMFHWQFLTRRWNFITWNRESWEQGFVPFLPFLQGFPVMAPAILGLSDLIWLVVECCQRQVSDFSDSWTWLPLCRPTAILLEPNCLQQYQASSIMFLVVAECD